MVAACAAGREEGEESKYHNNIHDLFFLDSRENREGGARERRSAKTLADCVSIV
jgi:hypothetical protein